VPTTKTVILPLYVSRLVVLISRITLVKLARKTRAVQIAATLISKEFKVIKIVIRKIIVITTIKLKLPIIQIKSRFADLSRRLKYLSNTIIITVSVHGFRACRRRLTI